MKKNMYKIFFNIAFLFTSITCSNKRALAKAKASDCKRLEIKSEMSTIQAFLCCYTKLNQQAKSSNDIDLSSIPKDLIENIAILINTNPKVLINFYSKYNFLKNEQYFKALLKLAISGNDIEFLITYFENNIDYYNTILELYLKENYNQLYVNSFQWIQVANGTNQRQTQRINLAQKLIDNNFDVNLKIKSIDDSQWDKEQPILMMSVVENYNEFVRLLLLSNSINLDLIRGCEIFAGLSMLANYPNVKFGKYTHKEYLARLNDNTNFFTERTQESFSILTSHPKFNQCKKDLHQLHRKQHIKWIGLQV